jgi:hypothetical protein
MKSFARAKSISSVSTMMTKSGSIGRKNSRLDEDSEVPIHEPLPTPTISVVPPPRRFAIVGSREIDSLFWAVGDPVIGRERRS